MTRFLTASLTLLFALVTAGYAQDASVKKTLSNDPSATSVKKSRGPVFRANTYRFNANR